MTRTCPRCDELNDTKADFCGSCGYRLVLVAKHRDEWGHQMAFFRPRPARV